MRSRDGRDTIDEATAAAPRWERIHGLDALRGVLMVLGIALHVALNYLPRADWFFSDPRAHSKALILVFDGIHSFRMPAFFVLSGFFGGLLWRRRGAKAMLVNRFDRLVLPLGVFAVLLWPAVVFSGHFASLVQGSDPAPLSNAVEEIGRVGFPPNNAMHLWFLYHLSIVVGLSAVCSATWDRFGLKWSRTLGFFRRTVESPWRCVGTFAALHFVLFTLLKLPGIPIDSRWLPNVGILFYYLGYYSLGWMLYDSETDLSKLQVRCRTLLAVGGCSVLVMSWAGLSLEGFQPAEWVTLPPDTIAWFLVRVAAGSIALVTLTRGSIGLFLRYAGSGSRVWRYISDSSYWVYLIHLPLSVLIPTLIIGWDLPVAIKFPLAVFLVSAVCWLSYDCLVRPTALGRFLNGRAYPAAAWRLSTAGTLLAVSCMLFAAVSTEERAADSSPWRDGRSAEELLEGLDVTDPFAGPTVTIPKLPLDRCVGVLRYAICPDRVEFGEAFARCAVLGGHPVVLETAEEAEEVSDLVKRLMASDFWLGLTDTDEEGRWLWTDGTPPEHEQWSEGEPNNWGDKEDCAAGNWKESDRWNDVVCKRRAPFVCEFDTPTPVPDTP